MRLLAAALGLALASPAAAGEKRPNLILISIDTLRADHLGCYGYTRPTSPNLDALARESLVFEGMTASSPKTAPAHMSLFTGLHPSIHAVSNHAQRVSDRLSPDIPTLATLLKQAGYRTAAYTGGGNVGAELGFDQGFDVYASNGDVDSAHEAGGLAIGRLALPDLARGKDPFFLFLHTYEVHDPYLPPPEYARIFVNPSYGGRIVASWPALADGAEKDWPKIHDAFWKGVDNESAADVRHLEDLYDGVIRRMDAGLGQLLEVFRKLGLEKNTILVFLSDHGEEFREHGAFTHDNIYEEVLRIPLVVRLPGPPAGRRIPGLASHVDVLPTLLELARINPPAHIQGTSLLPLLRGEYGGRFAFSEWPSRGQRSLRIENRKLIERRERNELYDLGSDPQEKHDLMGRAQDQAYALRLKLDGLSSGFQALKARFRPGGVASMDATRREELEALGYLR